MKSSFHRLILFLPLFCSCEDSTQFNFSAPKLISRQAEVSIVSFQVKVKGTLRLTVSQSINVGVEPHMGLMARYLLLFDLTVLFFWGAHSDEMTGLCFVYAADPHQRSLSVGPTTRRVTVEVFDPAPARVLITSESESYVTTDGQSANLSWNKAPIWDLRPDINYCLTVVGSLI
jgi:hypothetical protein